MRAMKSYAVLVATMAVARVGLAALGGRPMIASQALALSWPVFLTLALLGGGALFLAKRIGFSDRWSGPAGRWYALAIVTGLLVGAISASGDIALAARPPATNAVAAVFGTADVHEPFPASIFFYYYGAGLLEIMLRLIALTFLSWLFGLLRRPELAFWIANVIVSLYEPSPFMAHDLAGLPPAAWLGVLVPNHLLDTLFLANVLTGHLYRQ